MEALTEQERVLASEWGGGQSPLAIGWGKLMMWLFIISDALTFGALIAGYGLMRQVSPRWPVQSELFDMRLIGFMTFALISSSATMALAVGAAREKNPKAARLFLWLTILGGLIFLSSQAYEWTHFIQAGARLNTNPWGVPAFSAIFFVLTGFHGLHVTTGVIILLVTALRTRTARYSADGVETAGLYWHFVDVVWVFIFAFFYLL